MAKAKKLVESPASANITAKNLVDQWTKFISQNMKDIKQNNLRTDAINVLHGMKNLVSGFTQLSGTMMENTMKLSDFRKLVKEEVQKLLESRRLKEDTPHPNFEQRAQEFLSTLQQKLDSHNKKSYPDFRGNDTKLSFDKGKKYWRIKMTRGDGGGSVWGFLDTRTGDILKAAGWTAPAKGPRGNIFADDFGMKGVGPYGPDYLRGGGNYKFRD